MRITFLLPYAGMAGGIRVVAIYARYLRAKGHNVNVVSVTRKPFTLKQKILSLFFEKKWLFGSRSQGPTYFEVDDPCWIRLNHPGPIRNADVPDGDVVIATWWKTAEWISELSIAKGERVYFCQGYETHTNSLKDRVEATYSLPLFQVCVSVWVQEKIRELTDKGGQEIVSNGVDISDFYAPLRSKNSTPTFGFMFSPVCWKGADIIVKALKLAKKKNSGIKVICFGLENPKNKISLPDWVVFYENPPQESIREIYAQCDAWLFGSRAEGFGLPILEAMACRTPVIATPAGAAPELVSEGCGFIIPHEDSEKMSDKILEISGMDSSCWERMSNSAYKRACKKDWATAASKFERILVEQLDVS